MNASETLPPRCPTCDQVVYPDDPATVEGIEMQDHPTFQEEHDYVEGWHYYFHARCFPSNSPDWKRAS